ncbi:MAG: hypothetical protein M5R36_08900 [Deltaproteobacteria bacterium]|nr:hypothetical protein [Deltaproteobacteria bacterium]
MLGRNYRSTANILAVADAVIKNNTGRVAKKLSTENGPGRRVHLFRADDEYDEARFVAREIRELSIKDGLGGRDVAVFYRINAFSRVIEEELLRQNTPYVVVGGTRFYDRKEVKDVLAYLRLAVNATDGVAARRIINVPARKIGKTTIDKIDAEAATSGAPFLDAARELVRRGDLPTAAAKAVDGFSVSSTASPKPPPNSIRRPSWNAWSPSPVI